MLCDTCTARTPRALLRRTPRAAAISLAIPLQHTAAVRPVLALQPQEASAGCARGHWLSSPPTPLKKGSPKVRAGRAASRKRLPCAAGGAAFSSPPSPPQGRYPQGTLSAQPSADRSARPTARLPPPRAGLPAPFPPPWGTRCAAGSARCTDSFNVSGQAEGSIVTPQNLSRARLAPLGSCATLDRTCGAPAAA